MTHSANEANPWSGSLQSTEPTAAWRAAGSLVQGIDPDWYQLFAQLKIPKTLIFGALSPPDEDFTAFQQAGVATAIVPSAGHSMSWDNPPGLEQFRLQCPDAELVLEGYLHHCSRTCC